MRKQFNLQDWLKDKSQKVETRDGRQVKIISFEMTDTNDCPIAAQFRLCAGTPVVYLFDKEGHYKGEGNSDYDLFIVTPEEELNVFEEGLNAFLFDFVHTTVDEDPIEYVKKNSGVLLSLAREQLIKDGYVIEKKAFHDAVEKIDDKHKAEMSIQYSLHCKIEDRTRHAVMNWQEFQELAQKFINIGKAEALKDLPRWKKCADIDLINPYIINPWIVRFDKDVITDSGITHNGHYLCFADLEKLPKEDEK